MTIAPTQAELDAMHASAGDPDIDRAAQAMLADDFVTAEAILRSVLGRRPDDFVALRMLGEIAASAGFLSDAEALFRRSLNVAPGFAYARLHLATTLHDQERSGEAVAEFQEIDGDLLAYAEVKEVHADALGRVGEYEQAIRLYREILAENPANLEMWTRLAFLLKTVGRPDEALEACRKALGIRPDYGEAWWLLADMKTFKFSDEDIETLRGFVATPGRPAEDQLRLYFTLGKALEDRKESGESFEQYRAGNALRAAQLMHDPARITRFVDRSERLFTPEFFAERAGSGDTAPDPILIIGLPRSGSTLVEQILASHPMIEGTSELPDIYVLVKSLEPDPRVAPGATPYPELLADLPVQRFGELGALYLERTRIQRKTDRPFFIDKMPNNWMHVGFIRLILPNAKIIDTRRHPLACGFSNFRQLYATGQEFSYDLKYFGQHYADYIRLMSHFDRVLPGRIHRVIHERLVEEPEAEIRRLLDYLGVPFDEACLNFHETKRAVRTASAEQVRQPIRKEAADEWRAFEAELGSMKEALGPALDHWDDPQPD
ncbi:MAG TPA: sulfotransferase [Sphingomicrobium sp.]|nr:sulfotransferase [Sphingomicrobium sp.]